MQTNLESKVPFTGDAASFEANWAKRDESLYNHWTRGEPSNQIQLAFRMHWELFSELMGPGFKGRRVLEVGCGRASISGYFSDAGFDVTGLDLSPTAVKLAREIFQKNALKASFIEGDALNLPFSDASFDVVVSIGLLEHFENVDRAIEEQARILAPGGIFLGYVVPHNPNNIQASYNWVNDIIKLYADSKTISPAVHKTDVYRSDEMSPRYVAAAKKAGLKSIKARGVYPLPMISPSIDFPFTLMPPAMESVLVRRFNEELSNRRAFSGENPWFCDENMGQAFLVWGTK